MRYLFFSFCFDFIVVQFIKKNDSPKDDFDKLENIFSSDNWKVTGMVLIHHIGISAGWATWFHVYDFKIKEGDSSINEVSHINYQEMQLNGSDLVIHLNLFQQIQYLRLE
jgi:hypothetical protein